MVLPAGVPVVSFQVLIGGRYLHETHLGQVSSSLQLKPMAPVFTEKENTDDGAGGADDSLWSQFSSRGTTPPVSRPQ
ncbi:NFATC2-interacting protein [Lates japonicus]|uniref:NFATC2-interacting protein n=1 Tax=Lates japonicus TaxID=270547 RepID=A0AAD3NAK7_LATJO|nr:NFATC2-interacting protein [Lates japonicus]